MTVLEVVLDAAEHYPPRGDKRAEFTASGVPWDTYWSKDPVPPRIPPRPRIPSPDLHSGPTHQTVPLIGRFGLGSILSESRILDFFLAVVRGLVGAPPVRGRVRGTNLRPIRPPAPAPQAASRQPTDRVLWDQAHNLNTDCGGHGSVAI